jgi:hypothetical protein
MKTSLRPSERARYASLKAEIKAGLMGVARALLEVRDGKLYEEEYSSFAEFVELECGFTRTRAYQLIETARGEQKLLEAPIKVGANDEQAPSKVGAKALEAVAKIPGEHVAAVMDKATEGGTKPATAAAVKRVAAEIVPETQIEPVSTPKDSTDKYAAHKVTASEINGLASKVRQWQKDLAEKKRLTGGEYIDIDPIIDKVDVLVRMTRDMAFSGECPACQGKGCKECRKLGWVSVGVAKK